MSDVPTGAMMLSIVTVTYHSENYFPRCYASVKAHPPMVPWEWIVVENASGDSTVAWIREHAPEVQLVEWPENVGFGPGCNIGAARARGEWILLLNPDTEVLAGAIDGLLAEAQRSTDIGAVGGTLLNPDGTTFPYWTHAPSLLRLVFARRSLLSHVPGLSRLHARLHPTLHAAQDVDALSGAFMLVRRAAFEGVGGFDPAIFMYADDLDLSRRLRVAGWRMRFVPEPSVVHDQGHAARRDPWLSLQRQNRALIYYVDKHHPRNYVFRGVMRLACAVNYRVARWMRVGV